MTTTAAWYRDHALAAVPRLLGSLDRESLSPTAGSFDRDHWGWYFRDVPIGMLQVGVVPLSALWAGEWHGNPFARSPRLRDWIVAALEQILSRQRRNGSFDSVGPFTQDHGTTLLMAYAICTAIRYLGESLPADVLRRAAQSVRRSSDFARRSDEDYAFISNHRALFALAWLRAGALLADDSLRQRADREVRAILDRQQPEGWYPEYDGADPGYQSLGMSYLSQILRARPSAELQTSLRRAVEFMSHFVHPDGGLGGVYGSRMTSLWFPSGFETLARDDPLAGAIADGVARGIGTANVVTPATTDPHNLAVLINSYLLAADARAGRSETSDSFSRPELPCDALSGVRSFGESGLVVAGTPTYYAIMNLGRGGVGVVYSRAQRDLAFEDAGYVVRAGNSSWSSAISSNSTISMPDGNGKCGGSIRLGIVNRLPLTAGRFLVLRLLNLTLFRSLTIGAWIRRRVIRRLITRREDGPVTLSREIQFRPDSVLIRDRLDLNSIQPIEMVARTRAFSPIHMGSSRYFHARDLLGSGDASDGEAARMLTSKGTTTVDLELRFGADGAGVLSAQAGQ